eukprot:m.332089 g.332089  ORF g.332089 m.332089 type:complete len:236 (+) comp16875_c0_seq1:69-776(+)
MADKAALIAAAAKRAQAPPDVYAAQLRKDKKEAVRIARLKVKAQARGAAPPPPKPGAAAPAPVVKTSDGKPPEIKKYRAMEDYSGEVTFAKGDTIFVMGDVDDKGMIMGVCGGKSGMCPMASLKEITDELLAAERKEREEAAQKEREAREAEIAAQAEEMEKEELEKLKASDDKPAAAEGTDEEAELAAKARAAAAAKAAEEIAKAKEEEDKLRAEAARLEELMRQLDMSDDDDE